MQRPAAEISVTDIIYALDDYRGLTECSLQPNECSLRGFCHVQGNWQLISQGIAAALDSVSLDDLAKPALLAVDLERIKALAVRGVHRG